MPWLVLLVEPLHGITFAAMWSASVEYGQRIAPPGGLARMQALVNGLYYQIAMGTGSMFWGALVPDAPQGLGFIHSFQLDAVMVLAWGAVWLVGLLVISRCKRSGAREMHREAARALNSSQQP